MATRYPIYLAGEWVESNDPLDVVNPYSGEIIGTTFQASREQLEQAVDR
jgi:acyl-CoA reductase-like NAD-dependent aldehyde dehydrogenase